MTGIIKTDQLQGAQSTTITIPTGNKISITDSATIGTLNATTMKGVTTFADSSVFKHIQFTGGVVSGSFIKSYATNSLNGVASASVTGLSTTAKKLTLLVHDMSTSTGTPVRYRVRGNGADVTSVVYQFNSWYQSHGNSYNSQGGEIDHLRFHSDWAGAANTYNVIINFYKVGSGLFYNFEGCFFNRGTGGNDYTAYHTRNVGRILATHLIDGFTIYTTDGNNFDAGTMTAITEE